jgi:putative transposase
MAHTYTDLLYHFVWSTEGRIPLIQAEYKNRLYAYLRTAMKGMNAIPIKINGMPDHVHILAALRPNAVISDFVRDIKRASSKFATSELNLRGFNWQTGYGAFTVGYSNKESVVNYIENQEVHHKTVSFDEEFKGMLEKLGILYDPRFVLD